MTGAVEAFSVDVTTDEAVVRVARAELDAQPGGWPARPTVPLGLERRWTFSPAGVEVTSVHGTQAYSWAQVARFAVRDGCLVVTVAAPLLFVLPLAALTAEQHRFVQQWWVAGRLAPARGEQPDLMAAPGPSPGAVVVRGEPPAGLLLQVLREALLARTDVRLLLAFGLVVGLVGVVATVLCLAVSGRPDPFPLALVALSVAGAAGTELSLHRRVRALRRRDGGRRPGEATWSFDVDGLGWQCAGAWTRTPWQRVAGVDVRSRYVVARLAPVGVVVVPAAALTADDLRRVAGFARAAGVTVSGAPRGGPS